jgi:hypothetical protein
MIVFHKDPTFKNEVHTQRRKFMNSPAEYDFSGPVKTFHGLRLPEEATPVGYAALIDVLDLEVPLPRRLTATGARHRVYEANGWEIRTPRHTPSASLEGHLAFALKYEGLDLAVLARLFAAVNASNIEEIVRSTPTGIYSRRLWFLFEWLTGERLDLPDAGNVPYTDVLNPAQQFAVPGENVARHRVRNNLPGTPEFCPLVFRTDMLVQLIEMDLAAKAQVVVADVARDLLARTAEFLLLKDSKSSYAIEGERPPQGRIQRWGRAIGEAGRNSIDTEELVRLQEIVIGDARFVHIGLRVGGGFVGEHDRVTRMPLPAHVSARADDLPSLIEGMLAFDQGPAQKLDPVIAAAVLAFGFVYVHPFEDGNGRIHRYLIHHVLAQRGFSPTGVVFPVSAAILEKIDEYERVLKDYSDRLLPVIEWEPTQTHNVRVVNNTADFYRFFDATPHAEFLYECVRKTIEEDLPEETDFLRRYDQFMVGIEGIVDMPHRTIDLLFRFLQQNDGRLSQRARGEEFSKLTASEVESIEDVYRVAFGVD